MKKTYKIFIYVILFILLLISFIVIYVVKYGSISLVGEDNIENISELDESKINIVEIEEENLIITIQENKKTKLFLFWATWCKSCKVEMKIIENLVKKYNVDLVLISVDRNNNNQKKIIKNVLYKYKFNQTYIINYPTSFDINNSNRLSKFITKLVKREDANIPYNILYDKNNVEFVMPGFFMDSTIGYNTMDSLLNYHTKSINNKNN